MSDMFSAFTSFISDDPLMLTLCILIILLIIVFFVILFFGNNKNDKDKETKEIENTSSLLKSDLDNEKLKSTQEFSLQNDDNMAIDNNIPVIKELTPTIDDDNAPINIDEAMIIKNSRPNEEPVKIPNIDEIKEIDIDSINEHKDNNSLVIDENINNSTIKEENIFNNINEQNDNVQNVFHQKIEPPIKIKEDIKPTIELPKEPVPNENNNKIEEFKIKEEFDDIELPKLSSETGNLDSTLSSLNGEIFKMDENDK